MQITEKTIVGDLLYDLSSLVPAFDFSKRMYSALRGEVQQCVVLAEKKFVVNFKKPVEIKKTTVLELAGSTYSIGAVGVLNAMLQEPSIDPDCLIVAPFSVVAGTFSGNYWKVYPPFVSGCKIEIVAPLISSVERVFAEALVASVLLVNSLPPKKTIHRENGTFFMFKP